MPGVLGGASSDPGRLVLWWQGPLQTHCPTAYPPRTPLPELYNSNVFHYHYSVDNLYSALLIPCLSVILALLSALPLVPLLLSLPDTSQRLGPDLTLFS